MEKKLHIFDSMFTIYRFIEESGFTSDTLFLQNCLNFFIRLIEKTVSDLSRAEGFLQGSYPLLVITTK